jgi:hypothetical protein
MMVRTHRAAFAATFLLVIVPACSKAPDKAAIVANTTGQPASAGLPQAPPPDLTPQSPGDDPATFVPLRSDAVKDAIHRALRSGGTQRWHDGKLSGYAVPSLTTDKNGCRAVRYTVDQRPGAAFETINACDASL